jgi:pyridine nucleotide-disulfide oxidoreductase family protein
MKRLLLVGAGHAHARVLKDWADAPLPDVQVTVVSPSALAPYSGMVPGWLAGTYRYEAICIDFAALARRAGARFVAGEVAALDPARREVTLHDGTSIGYDLLSLNIGSTLRPPAVDGAVVLPLRPLARLREAVDSTLPALGTDASPRELIAVGGGAAGVECVLAMLARLRARHPAPAWSARLVTRSDDLLPGMARSAARRAHAALVRAGVRVHCATAFDAATVAAGSLLLWATGAVAHDWPRAGGLAGSARGFVAIDPALRSSSHPEVFAVGDCAEWVDPLPKAGVFAVRMGPVLSNNLRAALGHGSLRAYVPQRRYLALLATADGRAIATWGHWAAEGAWAWRWKDRIDRAFVRGHAAVTGDRMASPR